MERNDIIIIIIGWQYTKH